VADRTGIEWTDATWSPTLGCTKVSPGCDHCYAMRTVHRMSFNPNEKVSSVAEGLTAYRPGVGPVWTNLVRELPDRLDLPLHWRKPRMIFVDSQSDLFHDGVSDDFIARVWAVMGTCAAHTFQVLTKRHGRMRALLSSADFRDLVSEHWERTMLRRPSRAQYLIGTWPLPNVWLGVSVEDQKWADIRIPALLGTPAVVRFLSCEPLLGPIDLVGDIERRGPAVVRTGYSYPTDYGTGVEHDVDDELGVDWVIVGGESGPGARPMHLDWARSLRDQCAAAGVPFLFKQWGEWAPHDVARPSYSQLITHGTHWDGTDAAMARVGKKAAGRELDGRAWDEFPEVSR
jgi:protein gp37